MITILSTDRILKAILETFDITTLPSVSQLQNIQLVLSSSNGLSLIQSQNLTDTTADL